MIAGRAQRQVLWASVRGSRSLGPKVGVARGIGARRYNSKNGDDEKEYDEIRQIFDNERYWKAVVEGRGGAEDWKKGAEGAIGGKKELYQSITSRLYPFRRSVVETGLFRNPYLTTPEGLHRFTDSMREKAQGIVERLESDRSEQGLRQYVKNLDTLSDMVCKVIDLCEFIRISHPDPRFLEAAQQCYEKMFNYMNELNTNVDLYKILKGLLTGAAQKHVREQLSAEETVVGQLLYADFHKSGIDADERTRALFIELLSRISIIGQYFNNNVFDLQHDKIVLQKDELAASLPKAIMSQILAEIGTVSTRGSTVKFPVNSHIAFLVLKNSCNEHTRRKVWISMNSASDKQIQLLELLLNYRKILSLKLQYTDFNEYQLENKMAKNSGNVLVFLKNLERKIKPHCVAELKQLAELKLGDYENCSSLINTAEYCRLIPDFASKAADRSFSDQDVVRFIRPWDREYLVNKLLISRRRKPVKVTANVLPTNGKQNVLPTNGTQNVQLQLPTNDKNVQLQLPISTFFLLGTLFSKLSRFLTCIYGVKFKIDKPLKGEIWHSDVRKLVVVNADDETDIVGIIYLDLFERLGKSLNPAHFTIVCSRKVSDPAEIQACEILNEPRALDRKAQYIQCVKNKDGDIYQLPIITIVCNFSKTTKEINGLYERIALLRLSEVETLFHEIGHSLHSMFGRTNLHNVSGTRCLSDFVELPSILMETFSKDPRVLKFFGDHYNTNANQSSSDTLENMVKNKVIGLQLSKNKAINSQLPENKAINSDLLKNKTIGSQSPENKTINSQSPENKAKDSLIDLHLLENEVLKYCDIYSQLKMAYLDQQLYLKTPQPVLRQNDGSSIEITPQNSNLISIENLDQLVASNLQYSKHIYHQCEKDLEIIADTHSTWYGKFGHLFTYGAIYYTYLFDRAISSKVYDQLFLKDPFDHNNGKLFRDSVLKWGGSRNPWECIGECLNDPRLTLGNEESMRLIGEIEDVK